MGIFGFGRKKNESSKNSSGDFSRVNGLPDPSESMKYIFDGAGDCLTGFHTRIPNMFHSFASSESEKMAVLDVHFRITEHLADPTDTRGKLTLGMMATNCLNSRTESVVEKLVSAYPEQEGRLLRAYIRGYQTYMIHIIETLTETQEEFDEIAIGGEEINQAEKTKDLYEAWLLNPSTYEEDMRRYRSHGYQSDSSAIAACALLSRSRTEDPKAYESALKNLSATFDRGPGARR